MRWNWRYVLLCGAFMAMTFLTVWLGPRRAAPQPAPLLLDNWDIPQLAAYLNRAGVEVYALPTRKYGVADSNGFLMVVKKDWSYVNGLVKDASEIHKWRGIVYCARETAITLADYARQWHNHCLRVGPFIFYGDAELLARIGAALNHLAPVESP
jgi:hypothetical protein